MSLFPSSRAGGQPFSRLVIFRWSSSQLALAPLMRRPLQPPTSTTGKSPFLYLTEMQLPRNPTSSSSCLLFTLFSILYFSTKGARVNSCKNFILCSGWDRSNHWSTHQLTKEGIFARLKNGTFTWYHSFTCHHSAGGRGFSVQCSGLCLSGRRNHSAQVYSPQFFTAGVRATCMQAFAPAARLEQVGSALPAWTEQV